MASNGRGPRNRLRARPKCATKAVAESGEGFVEGRHDRDRSRVVPESFHGEIADTRRRPRHVSTAGRSGSIGWIQACLALATAAL